MPYRPEAELKRPDLKGEFLCGHCGKTFCHAASLNRHRLNFHGDDQQCQLCNVQIAAHETVRRHMSTHHQISRVFTCGCCNWTFPDKKELHAHNNSMMRTGQPGDAKAIAISSRPPGSLTQAELRGEDGMSPSMLSRGTSATTTSSSVPPPPKRKQENNAAEKLISQMLSQAPSLAGMSPEWLSSFLLNNPGLLPMLAQQQQNNNSHVLSGASLPTAAQSPLKTTPIKQEPVTSSTSHMDALMSTMNNNVSTEGVGADSMPRLMVKTEEEEDGLAESGIASGGEVTDSSPIPSDSSKASSPSVTDKCSSIKQSRKRKSVDAIASFLFQQKQCML